MVEGVYLHPNGVSRFVKNILIGGVMIDTFQRNDTRKILEDLMLFVFAAGLS